MLVNSFHTKIILILFLHLLNSLCLLAEQTLPPGYVKEGNNLTELGNTDESNVDHNYVDLGLESGIKWATCNVGASLFNDMGSFFAWGEIECKESYSEINSDTYNKTPNYLRKTKVIDKSDVLNKEHDVAAAKWGGDWRMPTIDEWLELKNECTWTWSNQDGQNGCMVTGPNGNSIFLPAAGSIGYSDSQSLNGFGEYGYYWSSSNYWYYDGSYYDSLDCAGILSFGVMSQSTHGGFKYEGMLVRPVMGKNKLLRSSKNEEKK